MWFSNKEKKTKKKVKKTFSQVLWEYAQSLGIALILALMIKTSVVEAYKIPSGSMEDTLLVGDFLLANKFVYGMKLPIPYTDIHLPSIYEPEQGDVIIFKYPRDPSINYIKRCIATEGQVVEIRDKVVYVDGKKYDDPSLMKHTDPRIFPSGAYSIRDNLPPTRVPAGNLFMMGDNRDNSADSRFWGFLDRKLVMGKAMVIHWSWAPDDNAPEVKYANPLSIAGWIGYNIIHFPQRVRWSRVGSIIS
ncbi:MAG: signal peptidase I [candidate division Zixibacteria bacterium]|nr:signal peptidase I [candidate division Zixibacteria bacterium]